LIVTDVFDRQQTISMQYQPDYEIHRRQVEGSNFDSFN
jgi:hypothetical protein